ncbi:MAG: TorF family putative porin [bacterium]|jgi:hypothetical protein
MKTKTNEMMGRLLNNGLKCIMTVAVLGVTSMVRAEDPAPTPPTAVAEATVLNGYVWRGQVLNNEAVLQPSFTLGKGAFTINTWGNMNLTDAVTEDAPDLSELDLTFGYSKTVGAVALGTGLVEYTFPNTTFGGTREVYASVGLPTLPIIPSLSVYYDFDEADGFYGVFSLAYSHSIAEKVTLSLFASLGAATANYNSFYFGVDENALNDMNVGASLSIPVTKSLTITPGVQYTALPDSAIKDGAAGLYKDSEFVAGSLKASYVF